jgi:hypothetical protein
MEIDKAGPPTPEPDEAAMSGDDDARRNASRR